MIIDPTDQKQCLRCLQWFPQVIFRGYTYCPACQEATNYLFPLLCPQERFVLGFGRPPPADLLGTYFYGPARTEYRLPPCKHATANPPCPGMDMGLSCDPPCNHYERRTES